MIFKSIFITTCSVCSWTALIKRFLFHFTWKCDFFFRRCLVMLRQMTLFLTSMKIFDKFVFIFFFSLVITSGEMTMNQCDNGLPSCDRKKKKNIQELNKYLYNSFSYYISVVEGECDELIETIEHIARTAHRHLITMKRFFFLFFTSNETVNS